MNLRRGFKRLFFVLSLIPVLIGIITLIVGLADDDDLIYVGIYTATIGFIVIWVTYGIVCYILYPAIIYVVNGFRLQQCENCEKDIGKLEESFTFNEHVVCAECYKRLNENQKD